MALQHTFLSYGSSTYPHYYLCNYLPLAAGKDRLSHSLLKFKEGRSPDLETWISCSLDLLSTLSFPPHTLILRALHHIETQPDPSQAPSLDLLGQALASRLGGSYQPTLLQKDSPTREIKTLSRDQRNLELMDCYSFFPPVQQPPHILLLDDVFTTGVTLHTIIGAIRQHYPHPTISLFTLARANYHLPYPNSPLKTNYDSLQQYPPSMQAGNRQIPSYSAEELQNQIHANSF
jgi:predicted amidophosphoribosyltransferase